MTIKKQKRAAKQQGEPNATIKVLRVEVAKIGESKEDDAAARTRLKELCEQVQLATNFVWMTWFAWHMQNGSAEIVRKWQAEFVAFRKGEIEKKPVLEIDAIPKELSHRLYHGIIENWPDLHTRVVVLLLNRLTSLIKTKKAAQGAFLAWNAILLYRESVPSSIRPLPIPFDTPKKKGDSHNAKLLLPETDEDNHLLSVSFAREAVPGKAVKASVKFDCRIWDRGRQMVSRRAVLKKIARGEYQMRGSQLCFSKGKIFADITYEQPYDVQPVGDKTAVVMPGRKKPLLMRADGRTRYVLGDGRSVIERRRQLISQRLGRKQTYREAPTSNSKGHGLHRSLSKVTKLAHCWRDFVTTLNRNLAAALVKDCQRSGIGHIVLGRPKKSTRFLSNAGIDDGYRDSTSWDWYALEKRILDKCTEAGITVDVRGEKPPFTTVAIEHPSKPSRGVVTSKKK